MTPLNSLELGSNFDGFFCSACKEWHSGLPLDWGVAAPIYWEQIPAAERSIHGRLTEDFCSIDDRDFFVRGLIEIPIIGSDKRFMWGVWVSLSRQNYRRTIELWNSPKRLQEPPYFGWLSNDIPNYPSTLNLKTNISARDLKLRPFIELEPTDHPLAVEQRNGITLARIVEIASGLVHKRSN